MYAVPFSSFLRPGSRGRTRTWKTYEAGSSGLVGPGVFLSPSPEEVTGLEPITSFLSAMYKQATAATDNITPHAKYLPPLVSHFRRPRRRAAPSAIKTPPLSNKTKPRQPKTTLAHNGVGGEYLVEHAAHIRSSVNAKAVAGLTLRCADEPQEGQTVLMGYCGRHGLFSISPPIFTPHFAAGSAQGCPPGLPQIRSCPIKR
jgi:hypothetical protein